MTAQFVTTSDLNLTPYNMANSTIKKMAHFEEVSSKITIGSAWNVLYKRAYKVGNVVFFSIEATTGTYVAEAEYTIATLSNDIKPKYTVTMFGAVTDGNYIVKSTPSILCNNNGTITVRTTNTNGSYWFINGWYYI